MTDMRDELLEQIVDELRTLPLVDQAAVRRIVMAASEDENAMAAARGGRAGFGARFVVGGARWLHSRVPLAAAAGLALAAGLAGYVIGGDASAPMATAVARIPAEPLLVATTDGGSLSGDRAVPTQFVLDAPRASRVALVGDFNAWSSDDTPLLRDPSSGIWTVTIRLTPGRHTYAFMIDGEAWTLDPRAPSTQDVEFGTPSSVVLVGTP